MKKKEEEKKRRQGRIARELGRIAGLDRYVRPEKVRGAIKLDSNENFALDSSFIAEVAALAAGAVDLREYPLDEFDALSRQLALYTGIPEKYIGIGSGSDQVIELLLTTIAGSGRRACAFVPTFSYFINRCELHGIRVDKVPLDKNFELDPKAFVKRAARSDVVYLCSPNNPTGGQLARKDALYMIDELESDDRLVLVDEAYADFAGYSLAKEATRRRNVIVLRTLSKAFGLAGARVGYMVANEEVAGAFNSTIQSPYPISTLSLAIAARVLERSERVKKTIEAVREERRRVFGSLSGFGSGIKAYRSDANFLFIEAGARNYGPIVRELARSGIVVKLMGDSVAGHRGCMRVTIGTREMNDAFLSCIERAVAGVAR
ncbi:aminotransferase class I/II-fold pyridoxal phosphate-dependent enzyme [Nitrososphaera sp.]|uniref:pyridoxal phosphate-dependent aminotransferase n=1 Tax=Nitrososphaera sp. TaxID=1971748 RepID=UPI00307F6CCF